jgi:hypothetical protein
MSVAENDRFRGGERKDAGDNEDWRSSGIGMEVKGASRFSSVSDSGV